MIVKETELLPENPSRKPSTPREYAANTLLKETTLKISATRDVVF